MDKTIILPCLCALVLGFVLTLVFKKLAKRWGFMDIPVDDRRMHTDPIPRIGGLAIYISFVAALLVTGRFLTVLPYIIGGAIVVVLGVIDDKRSLNASTKIVGQTLAGICLCFFGVTVDSVKLFGLNINMGILSYPLTVIFVIAVINMFNLIDGLDGLCCGLSVIAASALTLLAVFAGAESVAVIGIIFVFSCIGFFPHNAHRAKIFMGDTGSLFLGALVSGLAFALGSPLCLFIVGFVYMLEALSVILQVVAFKTTGKRLFKMSPFHHHLEKCGWPENRIVVGFTALTAILGTIYFIFEATT